MRKYRPIKKAKEGESVRFGSGLSISSGQKSSGYTTPDLMGGGMYRDALTPFKSYSKNQASSGASGTTAGGTTPRTGNAADAEELGVMMGSAERPELLLRQESDRTRDRIARRTYRAMKRGGTYDASKDLSLKGKMEAAKNQRLDDRIARQSEKLGRSLEASEDAMLDRLALDPESEEVGKKEGKAIDRAEKARLKIDKLQQKKVATPQSMQTKLDDAYRKEDAKELMRKKQGRYGFPYTEDTNLLPEHEEALRQQRLGQNIRGTYSYGTYTPTGDIKTDLYDNALSVADQIAMGVNPQDIVDPSTGERARRAKGDKGLKIKRGYRAIR
jgi:hypothetical protein